MIIQSISLVISCSSNSICKKNLWNVLYRPCKLFYLKSPKRLLFSISINFLHTMLRCCFYCSSWWWIFLRSVLITLTNKVYRRPPDWQWERGSIFVVRICEVEAPEKKKMFAGKYLHLSSHFVDSRMENLSASLKLFMQEFRTAGIIPVR